MKEAREYRSMHLAFIDSAKKACNEKFVSMFIGKARQAYLELEKFERAKVQTALFNTLIEKHHDAIVSCIFCNNIIEDEDRLIELLSDVVQFTEAVRDFIVNKYAGEFISEEAKAAVFYGYLLGKAGTQTNIYVTMLEDEAYIIDDNRTREDI